MPARLLLVPGGLYPENICRIHDQPLWGSLWPGCQPLQSQPDRPPYVCICRPAHRGTHCGQNLKNALEKLLQPEPRPDCRPIITIVDIAPEDIADHLGRCDVFYMCGGEPQAFADMFRKYQSTMDLLESIICSGQILYIGSCAGACILGSSYAGVRTMEVIPGMISISDIVEQIVNHSGTGPPVTMTKQTGLMLHGDESFGFVVKVRSQGSQTLKHLAEKLDSQVRKCSSLRNAVRYDEKGVPMDFESERIRSAWEAPPPPGLGPPQGLLPPRPPPGLPPPQLNVSLPSHHVNFMPPPRPPPPGPSNVSLPSIPEPPSPRLPPPANVNFPSVWSLITGMFMSQTFGL